MAMAITLADKVMAHAEANYEKGGWDVVVECWERKQIDEYLAECGATCEADAIDAMERLVGVWADRQAEARYQGEW